MKKWNHTFDNVSSNPYSTAHIDIVNKRSSDGWELVSTILLDSETLRLYWKREVTEDITIIENGK